MWDRPSRAGMRQVNLVFFCAESNLAIAVVVRGMFKQRSDKRNESKVTIFLTEAADNVYGPT